MSATAWVIQYGYGRIFRHMHKTYVREIYTCIHVECEIGTGDDNIGGIGTSDSIEYVRTWLLYGVVTAVNYVDSMYAKCSNLRRVR